MKLATLCYVIDKSNNKTLMIHRVKKQNDVHEGKWTGLGGKIDPGETPEECVVREIKEESGLNIKDPKLHGLITFPLFDGKDDWYVFIFTAHLFEGNVIDSNEGVLKWIDNDKIFELDMWEGDKIFLDWIFQEKFFSAKFVYKRKQFIHYNVSFY